MFVDDGGADEAAAAIEDAIVPKVDAIAIEPDSEELMEYPADCFSDNCYRRFPFLLGDEESPFWQGWANLRLKTFQLIENKYFETAVITMILLSSLALVSTYMKRRKRMLSICVLMLCNFVLRL